MFGLRGGPSDVIDPRTPDFIERKAKWPKFEKRNVANLFGPNLRNDEGLEVWLNATVTVPTFEPNGRVTEISARSDRGQELRVEAADFVIAAGGIESTRLALSFNRASADNLMATDSPVGHYFHEHLTAHCASVEVRDRRELGRLAGFLFQRDGMRNLRFELSGSARTREALPAAYTQLVFSSEQGGPFDVLRDIYRGFQAKSRPSAAQIAFLAGHAPWLLRAAWSRFIDHRLLPPDDAQFALNLAIEQQPKFESRIALSDRTDSLGQPLAMINWRPSAADQENFRAVTGLVGSYWQTMGFDCLGLFAARREAAEELVQCGGSHHPGGTLRMGRDAREGVVDADLRIFGSPNLWVASSAVFPRAGGANPTLTLVALALRLGDRLARD